MRYIDSTQVPLCALCPTLVRLHFVSVSCTNVAPESQLSLSLYCMQHINLRVKRLSRQTSRSPQNILAEVHISRQTL